MKNMNVSFYDIVNIHIISHSISVPVYFVESFSHLILSAPLWIQANTKFIPETTKFFLPSEQTWSVVNTKLDLKLPTYGCHV